MNAQVLPLKEEDYPELMEFLDRGFAPAASGFDTLLPARFTDRATCAECNYAIRDNGRLIAVAGVYPIEWRVSDTILRMAGIGNVAVDPDCRGRGLMSQLMRHIVQITPGLGFDLTWLGGYRLRYALFGYEKAGLLQQFFVTRANIRFIEAGKSAIRVQPFDPAENASRIAQLKAMHDRQAIRCERGEGDFPLLLRNWRRLTWVAERPDGSACGYAVANKDGKVVTEIAAADMEAAKALVSHLVRAAGESSVEFRCNAQAGDAGILLNRISEHRFLTTNGNWLIFDWLKMIGSLLRAHHQFCALPQGSVIIGIEGLPSNLKLFVDSNGAHCEWTNQTPDFSGDSLTVTRMLLGPANPSQMVTLGGRATILNAWCPLPAGFSPQDYV